MDDPVTILTDSPLTCAGAGWEYFRHGFMKKIPMDFFFFNEKNPNGMYLVGEILA